MDSEKIKEIKKSRKEIFDLLGYNPYCNLSKSDDGAHEFKATCPICGGIVYLNSNELASYTEFEDIDCQLLTLTVCQKCNESILDGFEKENKAINLIVGDRLLNIVDNTLFGLFLVRVKTNKFCDLNETLRLKDTNGKRFKIKLYEILRLIDKNGIIEEAMNKKINVKDIMIEDIKSGEKIPITNYLIRKDEEFYKTVSTRDKEIYDDLYNEEETTEETVENKETEEKPIEEIKDIDIYNIPENEINENTTEEENNNNDTENETNIETENMVYEDDDLKVENIDDIENEKNEENVDINEKSEEDFNSNIEEENNNINTSQENDEPEENETENIDDGNNSNINDYEYTYYIDDDIDVTDEEIENEDISFMNDIEDTDINKNEIDDDNDEDEITEDSITESEDIDNLQFSQDPDKIDFYEENEIEEKNEEKPIEKNNELTIDISDSDQFFPFLNKSTKKEEEKESVENTDNKSDEKSVEENISDKTDQISDNIENKIDISSETKRETKEPINNIGNKFINGENGLEDEIEKIKEEDKRWYNKTVFSDSVSDDFNEFMDEEDILQTFIESDMGRLIVEVKNRTNLRTSVRISEDTLHIPFVDFETGVRVICIDCDEMSQMKVNLSNIAKQVPFHFKLDKKTERRYITLYSDCLSSKKRIKATIRSLIKIVNRDNFDPNRIINLEGNYALFYTDNIPLIKEFESENSVYPFGKPSTKQIAIIAMRGNDGRVKFTSRDIIDYLSHDKKTDLKSFNLYVAASARYIAIPQHNKKTVEYTITQYTELSPTIIKDGFDFIVSAIVKEHRANNTVKDPNNLGFDFSTYNYSFIFEFDKTLLPSPSLEIWNDNNGFINMIYNSMYSIDYAYIRKPDFRQSAMDGWRVDERLFLPISLSKRFGSEISKSGLNITIESNRIKFIEQMGFERIYQPKVIKFMLNPIYVLQKSMSKAAMFMSKIDLSKFFAGGGVYDGGYDNILMQRILMSSDFTDSQKNMMNMMMIYNKMNKK